MGDSGTSTSVVEQVLAYSWCTNNLVVVVAGGMRLIYDQNQIYEIFSASPFPLVITTPARVEALELLTHTGMTLHDLKRAIGLGLSTASFTSSFMSWSLLVSFSSEL